MNQATIHGRVGKDPELKFLESGTAMCSFSVATTERWKDKNSGEKMEETQWHNIVVWGKRAEVVKEYVNKGDAILISGKIVNRSYDKTDGTKGYTSEIVMRDFEFGAKKGSGGNGGGNAPPPPEAPPQAPNNQADDDLPF